MCVDAISPYRFTTRSSKDPSLQSIVFFLAGSLEAIPKYTTRVKEQILHGEEKRRRSAYLLYVATLGQLYNYVDALSLPT